VPPVKTALISVFDKTKVVEFAQGLAGLGYRLLSTGGTASVLQQAGLPVVGVSQLTGFPEVLDGRVKTLHPAIFAGILRRRDLPAHQEELARHGLAGIDLVAVNLYPFAQVASRPGVSWEEAVELVDVGGVALLRAAAKNHESVIVVHDPADYPEILAKLRQGDLLAGTRRELARRAFAHTASYDALIAAYLGSVGGDSPLLPGTFVQVYDKVQDLRYGENPHQAAAFYLQAREKSGLAALEQLAGIPLSYNNLADADAALRALWEFNEPAAVVVKHANPCGVAVGPDISTAFDRAQAADPVSIFGGIVAVNRPVDEELAARMVPIFLEVAIAPLFLPAAREMLSRKTKLRLLEGPVARGEMGLECKSVSGGMLVQERDVTEDDPAAWRPVTRREPTSQELAAMLMAWKVVKHVKSNAIVVAAPEVTLGIGAGQMNRVNSTRLALEQAGSRAAGAALASDAMFPFADSVELAAKAGVSAIVQPGGSVRDLEVIAACDTAGMAMVFTGRRHFRH
jgi:phosphoribosylaminoimidazolecarboxamide formyltransferase/IMP cyclohydrolase